MKVWVVTKIKESLTDDVCGYRMMVDAVYTYPPSKREVGAGRVFETDLRTRKVNKKKV